MKSLTRLFTFLILLTTLFGSMATPAYAILGPIEYLHDVYIPAVYDDPNINLQKHIKETIMTIPWAMFDITFSWIFPTGIKFTRDCGDLLTKDNDLIGFINKVKNGANCVADTNPPAVILTSTSPTNNKQIAQNIRPFSSLHVLTFPTTRSYLQTSLDIPFIPTQTAYAQGYGYKHLMGFDDTKGTPGTGSVVSQLWTVSRNTTYLLSAIILVVMGLMVMFRVKLSPQVIITIEQVIPKFALTLLLITFSFAIVGFLIDLSYVAGYLISALVANAHTEFIDTSNSWVGWIMTSMKLPMFGAAGDNFTIFFQNNISAGVIFQFVFSIIMILSNIFKIIWAFKDFVIPLLGIVLGIVIILLVMVLLIVWAFLTFFALLKVYVSFIGRVIFGPFLILFGILPGGGGFGAWLTGLIQDLVTFTVVSAMFLIADVLLLAVGGGEVWSPPQLGINSNLALTFIAIGILLNIRKAPEMVAAFFAKKPFDFGSAIGEAAGPIKAGGAGAAFKGAGQWGQNYDLVRGVPGTNRWDAIKGATRQAVSRRSLTDFTGEAVSGTAYSASGLKKPNT